MALDKKQIALTVGGILAGLTLTYLLYRLEQNNAANNQAASDAVASEVVSQQPQQQQISVPSISVPTISATPSTTASPTDTSNQNQASAIDPTLATLLAASLSQDNSHITNVSTPLASITELPFPTTNVIPQVDIPAINNFSGGSTASPIAVHSDSNKGS